MTTRYPHRRYALTAAVAMALGSGAAIGGDDAQKRSSSEAYERTQSQNPQARDQDRQQGMQGRQQGMQGQQSGQDPARTSSAGQPGQNALDQLTQQRDDLATFAKAVRTAGIADALADDEYTLFAPTDAAFDRLGQDRVQQLLQPENRQQLIALIRGHIVNDDVDEQMFRNIDAARTIDGDTVALGEQDGKLTVGEAKVVEPNLSQGNLRVFVIDQVLAQEALQGQQARRQSQQQQARDRQPQQQRGGGQPGAEEEEAE